MIGCGLRREEVATLTIGHIQQRDARWVIVDMKGKGGRVRTVPMPSSTKATSNGTERHVWQFGFQALNQGRVPQSLRLLVEQFV
jgi:integrase